MFPGRRQNAACGQRSAKVTSDCGGCGFSELSQECVQNLKNDGLPWANRHLTACQAVAKVSHVSALPADFQFLLLLYLIWIIYSGPHLEVDTQASKPFC